MMDGEADSATSVEIEQNKCVGVAIVTFDVWKRTIIKLTCYIAAQIYSTANHF